MPRHACHVFIVAWPAAPVTLTAAHYHLTTLVKDFPTPQEPTATGVSTLWRVGTGAFFSRRDYALFALPHSVRGAACFTTM